MNIKEAAAKTVRVITVPPVMVCALCVLLFFFANDVIPSVRDLALTLVFLMVIPILAYPVAAVVPSLRRQGNEGKRRLAFILSPAGYLLGLVYGIITNAGRDLMVVYMTYMFSVIVLLVLNKFIGFRASGHACGIFGPLVAASYYVGSWIILPCAALYAAAVWASVYLKRHTAGELFWGSVASAASFAVSLALGTLLWRIPAA